MDRISCSYHNQAETLFDVNTEFVQICRYKMEVHLPTPITICNSWHRPYADAPEYPVDLSKKPSKQIQEVWVFESQEEQ